MANVAHQPVISIIYRILFHQILGVMGFILVILLLKNVWSALSAFAGAMAYCVPTFLFARGVTAYAHPAVSSRFMLVFFAGEMLKLTMSGMLFLFAISYLHAGLSDAVFGLISAILAFWIGSIICLYRQERAGANR